MVFKDQGRDGRVAFNPDISITLSTRFLQHCQVSINFTSRSLDTMVILYEVAFKEERTFPKIVVRYLFLYFF